MANKNQSLRFKLGLAKWRIWAEDAIQSLIDSTEKTDKDIEQILSDIEKIKISTSVFEKGLAKDIAYDWGADLVINSKDDVYFISLNPEVATVNQNGVVKMLVDDTNPAFAEILVVGKTNTERLLVFVEGLSGFRVYHNSDDDIRVGFNQNAWLVKPDGAWVELANGAVESCPKGWIYLISDDVSFIDISNNNLKGELKSLAGHVECSNNQLTSLSLPNATYVECNNNQLASLSLPNATDVFCNNNQLASLSVPNADYVECNNNQLASLSLPNAGQVECYNNQLTSLSLPNATEVYCSDNQLTSLSLPNAYYVECYNNQLTSLSLPNATVVECNNNQLASLSVPNATEVYCSDNQLTATAIAELLAGFVLAENENGYLDISEGKNAPISTWTQQAIADKDFLLNTLNWDVIYNE